MNTQMQNRKRKRSTVRDIIDIERPTKRVKQSSPSNAEKACLSELVVDYHSQWVEGCHSMKKSQGNKKQKEQLREELVEKIKASKNRIIALVGEERGTIICDKVRDRLGAAFNIVEFSSGDEEASESEEEEEEEYESDEEDSDDSDDEEENEEDTEEAKKSEIELKMAANGLPMNIQSGYNLLSDVPLTWMQTNMMEKEHLEYWTEFAQQIDDNDHHRLFELISELLDGLKNFSPNKEDHKKLDQLLDLKVIGDFIEKKSVDPKVFYRIFEGIWSQIKSLHHVDEDAEWDEWHDLMIAKMAKGQHSWGIMLSEILNIFTMKMDRIEYQIESVIGKI